MPLVSTLKACLRERTLLLLLDNFAHVVAAAPIVADLLMPSPRLKVLVTSRAPLHLRGEYELDVSPAGSADAGCSNRPGALLRPKPVHARWHGGYAVRRASSRQLVKMPLNH